jgi:hypothetical protein
VIADKLHADTTLALGPLQGIVAGMAAACCMVFVTSVPATHAPLRPWPIAIMIGTIVTGGGVAPGLGAGLIGGAAHVALGALLGLLYAASQQRIAADGLVLVGAFYGFVIWITSGVVARAASFAEAQRLIHSSAWLIACMVYGLCLAVTALWTPRLLPAADSPQTLMD